MDYKELEKSAFDNAIIFRDKGELSKAVALVRYGKAITDLLARAEAAEARVCNLEKLLSAVHNMEKFYPDENGFFVFTKNEADEITGKLFAAEDRAEKAEEIASELCEDFTDFVTNGIHNAAPYCANQRPECINFRGWCNGDNKVCLGFLPKAAVWKEE